jgi:monoamine oxidase
VQALSRQQEAERQIQGETAQHLLAGYDALVQSIYQSLRGASSVLRLSTIATAVNWEPARVEVCSRHATGYNMPCILARQCVVTVPLGVLQAGVDEKGAIRFEPEPPQLEAARQLTMGSAIRISLQFRNIFWESHQGLEEVSFLHADGEALPVWWTQMPMRVPLLTAWVGGPAAQALLGKRPDEIASLAERVLAKVLKVPPQQIAHELLAWQMHDWQSDPFSRGAYSYIPVGALDAPQTLATPVQNTLYFAGEATDTEGHWGTVHAALKSGLRAARQALAQKR